MQVVPFGIEALQRLQWLSFPTERVLGAPSELPIKEGVFPLGSPLFIVAFCLSKPSS